MAVPPRPGPITAGPSSLERAHMASDHSVRFHRIADGGLGDGGRRSSGFHSPELETMWRRLLERLRPSAMERRPMVDLPVVGRPIGTPPHRLPRSPILQTGLVAQRIHIATTMDDHHRFSADRGCFPACSPRPACPVRCGFLPTQQGRIGRSIQRH